MRKLGLTLQIFGWIVGIPLIGLPIANAILGSPMNWKLFILGIIFGVIPATVGKNLKAKAERSTIQSK